MANELMFRLAIEGPGKRLKEIKDQIDGWAKDMTIPIKLTADLTELKSQLKDLGVVFGENNKQIKKLADEVDKTIDRVNNKMKEVGSVSLKAGNIDRLHRMLTDLDVAIGRMEGHKWLSGENLKFSQNGQFYQQLEQLRELRKYIKELENDPNIGKKGWLSSLIWGGNGEQLMGGMTKRLFSTKTIDEAMKQMDDRMRQLTRQQTENAARYAQQMQQALRGGTGGTQREQWEVKRDAEAIRANYETLLNQLRHLQQIRAHMSKEDPDFLNLTGMTNKLREFIGEYSRLMNNSKVMADPTAAQKFGDYFMKVWQHINKVTEAYDKLNQQGKASSQTLQAPIDMKSINEAVFQVARLEERLSRLRDLESKASGLGIDTSKLKTLMSEMESYLTKFRQVVDNGGRSNGGLTAQMLKSEGEFRSFTARISENTRELGRNIAEKNRGISAEEGFASAIRRSTNELRGQSLILGDIRSLAKQYVSVWAAKSFINNLIEQGGLLEQQRLSIGAILRDTAQANSLFEKIKGLALKSPFGVTELDAMTKQLSAYGFQYSELYDWTKRLADISAATGTEVSRLALALGHVRSEGALSGYTLRQFSMGNIPMLEKLSEKLGKTSAEIRKMVSKKEIGYDQVLEVFKELTDEGGMFYNAQETMAEALNAKFKNLRDSYQIMYSEMAEGAPGDALKKLAETLTELSKNWRVLLPMVSTGVGLWGISKAATAAFNWELARNATATTATTLATSKFSVAQLRAIATTKALHGGLWRLPLAMNAARAGLAAFGRMLLSPATLGFAAIEGLVYLWQKHNQEVEKAKELTSGFSNQSSEAMKNLKERLTDVDPYSDGLSESKLKTGIEAMTETLKNYAANSKEVLNTAFGEGADGKVKSLAEQYQYLRGEMEKTVDVFKEMQKTADSFEFGVNYTDGGWFDDNVETDLTDYANAFREYDNAFTKFTADNQLAVQKSLEAVMKMEPVFKAVSEDLKSDAERVKWLYENQDRWGTLYNSFKGQLRANGADYGGVLGYNTGYRLEKQRREAERELDSFFVGVEERMKKFGYDFTNNGAALTEVQVGNLLKQSKEWLNKHPEWQNIYDVIWNKLNQRWGLPITPEIEDSKKPLNEWQQQMQEWLDKKGSTIKIKPEMTRQAIIDMVHNSIKETQAAVDQTKPILMRFKADLTDLDNLPIGLQTPWGRKQAADYKAAAPQNQTARDFLKEFGLPDPKEKNKGNKSHEDKELKAARVRLEEVKSFLSEYKKYRETYGKYRAINILEDIFPTTKGRGHEIVDNFKKVLGGIKNSLYLNTDDRKKFGIGIDKLIADTDLSEAKEKLDRQMNELQEYMSKQTEKYNLYRSLLEKTGNKDFAMSAFTEGRIWDGLSKEFADELKTVIEDAGQEIDVEKLWGMTDAQAKEELKNVAGAYELWKKIVDLTSGNYKKSLEDSANALKENMTYEERIVAIRERYKNMAYLGESPEQVYTRNKNMNAEIAQVQLDELKDKINWEAIFGNLTLYTKKALVDARNNLKDYIKLNRDNMDVKTLKETEEAVSKLNAAIADKSGLFAGMSDAIKEYTRAVEEQEKAEKDYQNAVKQYGANSIQAQDARNKLNIAQNNVTNAQGNLNNASDNTLGKVTTLASSLVTLGKKEKASLSEVGSVVGTLITTLTKTNSAVGNLIAAIFSLLDSLGNDPMGFVGNLFKSVGNGVYGVNSLLNPVGNIYKDYHGNHKVFGDNWLNDRAYEMFDMYWTKSGDYSGYEKVVSKYEKLSAVWDDLINKKKTYLDKSWGTEAQQAAQEALELLKAEKEAQKVMGEARLGAGVSMWSHSLGYRMWEGSYDYNGINWKDVANEISVALGGVKFSGMEDMLNMTSEQLQWIKENYVGLWAMMDEDFRNHLENIIKYGDEESEIIDKMKEKLTGWNFDSIKTEWAELLSTMDNESDKLADNLEDKLKNAILNSMMDNLFTQKLQALIDSAFTNETYIDKNGNVRYHHYDTEGNATDTDVASEFTKEEYDALMLQAQANADEAAAVRDMLKLLYGWTDDDSSSSSASSSIKGITEQTADLLASYLNSTRASTANIENLSAQYFPMYYNALTSSNASLRNLEEQARLTAQNTDAIKQSNQAILDRIDGLRNKAWKVPVA